MISPSPSGLGVLGQDVDDEEESRARNFLTFPPPLSHSLASVKPGAGSTKAKRSPNSASESSSVNQSLNGLISVKSVKTRLLSAWTRLESSNKLSVNDESEMRKSSASVFMHDRLIVTQTSTNERIADKRLNKYEGFRRCDKSDDII